MALRSLLSESVNYIPYSVRPWIRKLPGIANLQRWLVTRFLSNQPFVHTINVGPAAGLRFEVSLPNDKSVWTGVYEREFTTTIVEHIKPGDVCYDIGGYRGYMSGAMALAGGGKVIAFEPLPANQRALRRLCELNPQLPVNIMAVALGSEDGAALLKVMPDASMGKLSNSSFQSEITALSEVLVNVRKIDSLLQTREIPPPDVVKIDVEGAEADVLTGAREMLRVSRPRIFLEAHGGALEEACSQQLVRLGYRIRRLERHIPGAESTRHLVCLP
jgi:FkbM family methyltransferase